MLKNNENDIDYELERAQKTLISLYKISLTLEKIDNDKIYPFSIYIGDDTDLVDGTLDKNVLESKKDIFEKLKKEKIVSNFVGPVWEEEYPGSDMGGSRCYVNGEFYPNKVISCLEKTWKSKQELSKEIISSYRTLIDLVQKYFTKPILSDNPESEDKNRKSNEIYCFLSNKIIELYRNLDKSLAIRSVEFSPYIPFASLFSALKELKKKRMSIKDAIANMVDFYGKLTEIEDSFKLETYSRNIALTEIDQHVKSLRNDESKNKSDDNLPQIKNITVVEGNGKQAAFLVLNKNYIKPLKLLRSKNIQALIESIKNDSKLDVDDVYNCKSYLNSNLECILYKDPESKKQIYSLTKIVDFTNSYDSNKELKIIYKITTDTIPQARYARLLAEQKSKKD